MKDFGTSTNTAEAGNIVAADLGYQYTLLDTVNVAADVKANAGQTLDF